MLAPCVSKWITHALSASGQSVPSVSPVTSEQTVASSIDLALLAPWWARVVKSWSVNEGTVTPLYSVLAVPGEVLSNRGGWRDTGY